MILHDWLTDYINFHFEGASISKINGGASGAKLYTLNVVGFDNLLLKVDRHISENESLSIEVKLISWLKSLIFVPTVIQYECVNASDNNDYDVFVMTKLEGKNLKVLRHEYDKKEVVRVYGRALRALHSLPFKDCPVWVDLDARIEEAKLRTKTERIDTSDFEKQYMGIPVESLLEKLEKTKPVILDLVCAHGDYCLDNVMAKDEDGNGLSFTGFIDMGRGGVQDRYQDIALAIRSVRKHLGLEYEKTFLEAYGLIDTLDVDKVNYYILLDEFF